MDLTSESSCKDEKILIDSNAQNTSIVFIDYCFVMIVLELFQFYSNLSIGISYYLPTKLRNIIRL